MKYFVKGKHQLKVKMGLPLVNAMYGETEENGSANGPRFFVSV